MLLDWDGKQIAGSGGRHSEWPIHSEIFRMRPDVNVVVHSHPLYASIFSAVTEPLQPYTLDADYFIDVPRHEADVALITLKSEGEELARSLGENFAVLMANHGVTFCGTEHRARGLRRNFPGKGLRGASHRTRRKSEGAACRPRRARASATSRS